MKRRDFVVGAGATLSLFPAGLQGVERERGPGGLERRALGKTGEKLSIIGFGGIVVTNATDRAGVRAGAGRDRGGRQLLRRGPELRQRRGHAGAGARAPPQGRLPRLQDPGADPRGGDAGARELAAEDAHRPLRPLPAPRGHEPEGREDDPRPRRRHGGLRGGEEGGQGPLPRLLGALGRGGDRAPGRLRVRHDPLPGQLRHLARRRLRAAGAREGEGEGHGHPLPEGDGQGPVAGRRGEALRQVLVRAARHAARRPRWACASRCPTR